MKDIHLLLENIRFKSGQIPQGWLQRLTKNISQLEIDRSKLNSLGNGVFSNYPFTNLQHLVIRFSNHLTLVKDNFYGSQLQTLNLEGNDMAALILKHNCLEYISPTLLKLIISKCLNDGQVSVPCATTNVFFIYLIRN